MTRRPRTEDLTALALPSQPALSPDGSAVVYVLTTVDADADKNVRSLWLARTGSEAGSERELTPRRLTQGTADSSPAWSPDGTKIAFLRGGDGPAQVWLLPMDGGEPEQLTSLPLGASAPAWSPDGTKIAFGAPVDLHAIPGEDDAARKKRANAPVSSARLDYKADGAGILGTMRQHLHVVDLASGDCRQVTDGDWHAGDPAWSPDGTRIAFSAATAPDADLEYRAPVYVLAISEDAISGNSSAAGNPGLVALAEGVGGPVLWTADGSALLVTGFQGQPVGHQGLLRIPLDGADAGTGTGTGAASASAGGIVSLTASLDRNVMPGGPGYPGALPQLAGDGETVIFCVRDRGCTHVYAAPADGSDAPRPVVTGAGRNISGMSVGSRGPKSAAAGVESGSSGTESGGTLAVILATPASYGEVVLVDLETGNETVLTSHGAGQEDVEVFVREEREFPISDGTTVHGWVIRDPAAEGPGPLLLDIHGGPHNAWNGAADPAHLYHQDLAARGWTVLLLNPRASDGYGEAFYNATIGAWGTSDIKDFLEPVDALVAEGVADPARLAVTGYSYGGYMSCFLTSRDSRFAAAVAGGSVTDLDSLGGTSDLGHVMAELEWGGRGGKFHGAFGKNSPLTRVGDVRTPTLLLHGEADLRCPVGQAELWHTALRAQGVPVELVRYPGESHLLILDGAPSHRIDYGRRVVDWVTRYVSESPKPAIDAAYWRRRLAVLAAKHKVPGASLGILRLGGLGEPDEIVEAVYGTLNARAGIDVTTDSLFQIGSISKVWTATVVMQLVDEGLLDLDAPASEVLPELRLGDPDVAKTVTMRQLLNHTSGIDGDVFTDTGRGDDCVEKYVAGLADVQQNHPLGVTWSYCNAGFVLAGRVIEKITGQTWDAALRERIFEPLGLSHTVTLPEEALLFRAASGHVDVSGDTPVLAPVWSLPRALGPAGLICSTPADVLGFARLHLTGGLAPDGTRVLSSTSASAMTSFQADLPDKYVLGDSWGLGWIRFGWDGQRLIGHDGNTIGQAAFLRLLPSSGLAVTLLTNGGNTRDLYEELYREIFGELAGVAMPAPLTPPAAPVSADITPHLGTYERAGVLMEVLAADPAASEDGAGSGSDSGSDSGSGSSGPVLRTTVTGPIAEMVPDPVSSYPMTAISQDLYVVREPSTATWVPVTFYALPTGEKYVHFGARATPKAG